MQAALDSTQQKLPIQREKSDASQVEKKDQEQVVEESSENVSKKVCLTKRLKIIIGIICLIIIGAGLGVGLYFRFRPSLESTGPITLVNLGNGGYYAVGEFQLTDKVLFGNDTNLKLMLTQAAQFGTKENSRLLQEGDTVNITSSEYSVHANLEQGFQLSFTASEQIIVRVDPEILLNYLVKTQPEAARLLAEMGNDENVNDTKIVEDLQIQLSKVFTDELNQSASTFDFKPVEVVQFIYNNSTSSFVQVNGTQTQNATKRMLTIRSLWSLKKFFSSVGKIVKKIVAPIVNIVRKNGPLIGKVAGAIIGGVVGGPVGAVAGYQIGSKIGVAAQVLTMACIPQNSLTIKCTKDQVQQAGKIAIEQTVKDAVGGIAGKAFKTVVPPGSKSMVLQAVSNKVKTLMK